MKLIITLIAILLSIYIFIQSTKFRKQFRTASNNATSQAEKEDVMKFWKNHMKRQGIFTVIAIVFGILALNM